MSDLFSPQINARIYSIISNCQFNPLSKPQVEKAPRDDFGYRHRAGCLPLSKDGTRILLITSSKDQNKWILPAGTLEEKEHPTLGALRETEEEAGVRGVLKHAVGLLYEDEIKKTKTHYYVMKVKEEEENWEEAGFRLRRWFDVKEAIETLDLRPKHAQVLYDYLQATQIISSVTKLSKSIIEYRSRTEEEAAVSVWHKKKKKKTKEFYQIEKLAKHGGVFLPPKPLKPKKERKNWIAARLPTALDTVNLIKNAPLTFKHTPTLLQLAHEPEDAGLDVNESSDVVINVKRLDTDYALHLDPSEKILKTEPAKKWIKVMDRLANCAEFKTQKQTKTCVKNFLDEEWQKKFFNLE